MRIARRLTPALVPALLLAVGFTGSSAAQDPPDRVGRLSFLGGNVSFRPGDVDDWTTATVNYPLKAGDDLWADDGARAEITLGSAAVRLAPATAVGFLALDDQTTQIRLTQGSLLVRVQQLADDETFEIDTPNGAVSLLQAGTYRVDADANGDGTTLTVREGRAEVTAGGATFSVDQDQAATVYGVDSPSYDIHDPLAPDEWEQWSAARDRRRDASLSAQYVSPEMPGYEDLDDAGDWRQTPEYGPVWTPRRVAAGWAPYRNGHWAWVDPWGWTWIDEAPWGFAPYHYGRWAYIGRSWAWVPGRVLGDLVYAPALVAFVGGSNWSISAGRGGGVGWFPLGPNEVYVPGYRASDRYVRSINMTTVNVRNLTLADMTNVTYRNRTAPGGVTVVTRETFVGARPVGRSLIVVTRDRLNRAPIAGTAAPFAPTRESVLRQSGTMVRRPPAVSVTRRVVVRTDPPAPPIPFSLRERALQEHPGRPLDDATLGSLRGRMPPGENPLVRPATGRGGRGLRPARPGLTEARPLMPGHERRRPDDAVPDRRRPPQGEQPGDREDRGRRRRRPDQPPQPEPTQPVDRGAPPPREDRGRNRRQDGARSEPEARPPVEPRRPVDRPSVRLPTPPRLPAEPAQPTQPPAPPPPPPPQDRGGRPQPEPRPPVAPPTPEQPRPAEPPAPPQHERPSQPNPRGGQDSSSSNQRPSHRGQDGSSNNQRPGRRGQDTSGNNPR